MRSLELAVPLYSAPDHAALPDVIPVHQRLDTRRLTEIPGAVARELARPEIRQRIRPGQRIAIGVGSRGIDGYVEVVTRVAAELRALGAEPFLAAAMGGHGGGTVEGQRAVLDGLGLTEAAIGIPLRPSTGTTLLGTLADGTPVHFDATAAGADGIVVVNRIKAHTLFRGPFESGLAKMIVVGFGMAPGAAAMHGRGTEHFPALLPEALALVLAKTPVLFGVALVENGHGQLAHVEAVPAEALATREPALLQQANASMATIYLDQVDVLVLANFGKDISGQGADPNVIGRNARAVPVFGGTRSHAIVALELTPASHGNASGMGMMDFVTARFARAIDFDVTYKNVGPTGYHDLAALPMVANTDADAVALAIATVPGRRPEDVRLVYARDTKHLDTIYVSSALRAEVEAHPSLEIAGPARPLAWADGALFRWDH